MTEKVELVAQNKKDLVSEELLMDIMDRIDLQNSKSKVVKCMQSTINVMKVLNTRLFDRADMEENSVMIAATKVDTQNEVVIIPECCTALLANGAKNAARVNLKMDNWWKVAVVTCCRYQ